MLISGTSGTRPSQLQFVSWQLVAQIILVWLGQWQFLGATVHTVYELIVADRTAKGVQEFYNLPGISIPHGWAVSSVPIIYAVNWVLDRIPGVKDINWDEGTIREKWGIFGDPLILGAILGIVVGALGGLWKIPFSSLPSVSPSVQR